MFCRDAISSGLYFRLITLDEVLSQSPVISELLDNSYKSYLQDSISILGPVASHWGKGVDMQS